MLISPPTFAWKRNLQGWGGGKSGSEKFEKEGSLGGKKFPARKRHPRTYALCPPPPEDDEDQLSAGEWSLCRQDAGSGVRSIAVSIERREEGEGLKAKCMLRNVPVRGWNRRIRRLRYHLPLPLQDRGWEEKGSEESEPGFLRGEPGERQENAGRRGGERNGRSLAGEPGGEPCALLAPLSRAVSYGMFRRSLPSGWHSQSDGITEQTEGKRKMLSLQ